MYIVSEEGYSMTAFTISIAGFPIRIEALYESTRHFCRDYLCEQAPVLRVHIEQSDLDREYSRLTISVALVRGSPLAGVTRYPCPMEPGLSSRTSFRIVPAVARPAHMRDCKRFRSGCQ